MFLISLAILVLIYIALKLWDVLLRRRSRRNALPRSLRGANVPRTRRAASRKHGQAGDRVYNAKHIDELMLTIPPGGEWRRFRRPVRF